MARISSIGSTILIEKDKNTGINITSISNANPPVVTISGVLDAANLAAIASGWVRIYSTTSSVITANIPNYIYRVTDVTNVTNATFKLIDVDLSGLGAAITPVAGEAKMATVNFTEADVTTLSRESPAAAEIDLTTLADNARVTAAGLPNSGTLNMSGFYNYSDVNDASGYAAMANALDDGNRRFFVVEFRDDTALVVEATQTQLSESMGVDAGVAFDAAATIAGGVSRYKAAGAKKNYLYAEVD